MSAIFSDLEAFVYELLLSKFSSTFTCFDAYGPGDSGTITSAIL